MQVTNLMKLETGKTTLFIRDGVNEVGMCFEVKDVYESNWGGHE